MLAMVHGPLLKIGAHRTISVCCSLDRCERRARTCFSDAALETQEGEAVGRQEAPARRLRYQREEHGSTN